VGRRPPAGCDARYPLDGGDSHGDRRARLRRATLGGRTTRGGVARVDPSNPAAEAV
jgi:hypothetical protein